jgi:hypothetical protein
MLRSAGGWLAALTRLPARRLERLVLIFARKRRSYTSAAPASLLSGTEENLPSGL